MAVMPIPMPSPWFLLLLFLPYTSDSTSAPDVDLDNIINNAGGDTSDLFSDTQNTEAVDEAHVVVLTATNFSSFLATHRHVMVDFYVPWCYWSRKLAPEYAAAASHMVKKGLDVALAKVNFSQNNQLARAHDVLGSPIVHFFIGGVPRGYHYYGERTK
ncbi:protein disulfide isomerase-like 1-4 [Triticum dicoccoides]|uniref:protein disulfide isomerase-like 1-4 n=1 Tax=Triticum dicoccoides TaxID=85692 RepID=UPI0018916A53|nr:protein disulfide isomerase-like 1-4 [Triticum dicoccoides]